MIYEVHKPIPCITHFGKGYIWYITESSMLENDQYTVIMCHDGSIKHFMSDQVNIWHNETYGINKKAFEF